MDVNPPPSDVELILRVLLESAELRVSDSELQPLRPGFEALRHGRSVLAGLPLSDVEPAATLCLSSAPPGNVT